MSFAYLPLYTGDYLRDTRHLTPLRHGVYLLALMYCWDSKGPMPLDEQECSGICNCRSADEVEALRYVLNRFFVKMEDGHYNARMQREVERSEAISSVRADAGRRGANERMQRFREANAKQMLGKSSASDATPIPNPILSPAPALTSSPQEQEISPRPRAKRSVKAAPSAQTWEAYAKAYAARYGVEPVRNASVNGQLAQVVGKLGEADAPPVAAFFLSHQNALYVRAMHPVQLLLRDAEKLRTEWVTGRTVTSTQATLADRTQTNANVFGPMIEQAQREASNGKR